MMASGYVRGNADDRPPEPKRFKEARESSQRRDNRFVLPEGTDPINPDPSIVVHARNLSPRATEADLLEALSHFGPIAYATCMTYRRMALVEFEHLEGARACVEYGASKTINVAGEPCLFNYSTSRMIQRVGLESEKPNKVLMITIYNAHYPITVDIIKEICSAHGVVQRIAIIRRKLLQALVEFENVDQATVAKKAMNGADIYSGCCTLKVEYAKPDRVKVPFNNADNFDYTITEGNRPPPPASHNNNNRKTLIQPEGGDMESYPGYPRADGYGNGRGTQLRGFKGDPYGGTPSRGYYDGSPGFGAREYSGRGGYDHSGYEDTRFRRAPPSSLGRGGGGFYVGDRYQGHGAPFGEGSSVLMLYGIDHNVLNCDKVFNLLCQYGNVERVKFMLKKTDTCMVEMGQPTQVSNALAHLQNLELFGLKLTLRPSKQTEVREQGMPFDMPDGTPSFRDYAMSRNQRYSTPESAIRNRVNVPTSIIHWFNAPPNIDEQRIWTLFKETGAPEPTKVTLHESRTGRSAAGLAEFPTIKDATEALSLTNHTPVSSSVSKVPFIVKMAYYSLPYGKGNDSTRSGHYRRD